MTTSAADHAKALRLIQETGATLDQANAVMARFQANAVMARFNAAGIHLVSIDPPVEPQTGPKAENHRPAYVKAKAAIAEARKKTSAATQEEA
ncbi:MAG TPA: hypothetical protein VF062_05005 [Candidatus Limnocylindrales bacterium]